MNTLWIIETKAVAYEKSRMMSDDSEVEIDVVDGAVWLCDYSESKEGAECVEELCNEDDVDTNELVKMCNKHGWAYVL